MVSEAWVRRRRGCEVMIPTPRGDLERDSEERFAAIAWRGSEGYRAVH
jgi:hypothetical protein